MVSGKLAANYPFTSYAPELLTSCETSGALRAIYVRRVAVEDFGRFHHGFRQRGMRMDREGEVFRGRSHLDRVHPFGDQFAGARTADADAEHALALRIDNQLG